MYKYNKDIIERGLTSKHIGKKLIFLDEVDSTNMYADRLAKNGEIQGCVVISDSQSAGRGRLERKWFSPPGVNLYLSFILRPAIQTEDVNIFTFISSISTVSTLSEYGLGSEIKWPNDVLINQKKVSGVLTELNIADNKLEYAVVGVGINLNLGADHLRNNNLAEIATSVCIERGEAVDRNRFLIKFLNSLDHCYDDFINLGKDRIYSQWTAMWGGKDKIVRVSQQDGGTFEARCIGLDDKGYMVVEKSQGRRATIVSGDVDMV